MGSNGLRRTMFNGTKTANPTWSNLKLTNPSNLTISKMITLQLETSIS
jgi:hypothetical protein